MTSIGSSSFSYSGLKEIVLPESIESIGRYAFDACEQLTKINIPANIKSIEDRVFACTVISEIEIPEGVVSIGDEAFCDSAIQRIKWPSTLKTVGASAFSSCEQLAAIEFPDGVESIGEYALAWCDTIGEVIIPASVTDIGDSLIYKSPRAILIVEPGSYALTYAQQNNLAYDDGSKELQLISVQMDKELIAIGDTLTWRANAYGGVGEKQYSYTLYRNDAEYLNSSGYVSECVYSFQLNEAGSYRIAISIIDEAENTVTYNGAAFDVKYKKDLGYVYQETDGEAKIIGYDGSLTGDVEIPKALGGCRVTAIESEAFAYQKDMTSVVIPDSVENIDSYAFTGCNSLKEAVLPSGLTRISDGLFSYCLELTEVVLPESLTVIDEEAFAGCYMLSNLLIPGNTEHIGDNAFNNTAYDFTLSVYEGSYAHGYALENGIPFELVSEPVGYKVMENEDGTYSILSYTGALEGSLYIPGFIDKTLVTIIDIEAFKDRDGIMDVSVPDSVLYLGERAFSGCLNLGYIELSDKLISIGAECFASCDMLTGLTIPASVEYIGENAFTGTHESFTLTVYKGSYAEQYAIDNHIAYEIIEAAEEVAGYRVMENEDGTFSILGYTGELPENYEVPSEINDIPVTMIDVGAFSYNNTLTSVVLPETITGIWADAFYGCVNLESMTIHEGVTHIGERSFSNCHKLTYLTLPKSVTYIGEGAFDDTADGFELYVYEASYAHEWCMENGLTHIIMVEIEGYPEVVPGIDFDGKTVYIYDYWSGEGERAANPSKKQQATYDYQDWLMSTYNVNIVQCQKGNWATNVDEFTDFAKSSDGTLCLYILPPDHIGTPVADDLCAAWGSDLVDFSDDKWNTTVVDFTTIAGKVYGTAVGKSDPRQCLFFNKRILEEAGIDWESIYDMQKAGTWTWSAFESILKKIPKDTDEDGELDVYALTGNSMDLYLMGVFSNGADFFHFNKAGDLEVGANSTAALEGLQWAKDIWTTYAYQQPADANWNYYKDAWNDGLCGFYMYQTYGGFNSNSEMADMVDEWGCVAFPIGPKGNTYLNITSNNITVIPNVYDSDTVSKLAFIYDMWTNPTPGYSDEYSWIGNKYQLTDKRAVEETYGMLREPEHCVTNAVMYIGNENDVLGPTLLWSLETGSPAALVEAAMPGWQSLCDAFNGK